MEPPNSQDTLDDVVYAYEETIRRSLKLWFSPDPAENEIFCQFLLSQTFYHLQLSAELLSDFYTMVNADVFARMGEKDYSLFCKRRSERFHFYWPLFDALAQTPFFKEGVPTNSPRELDIVASFGFAVLEHVDPNHPDRNQAIIDVAFFCLKIMTIHASIILGGRFEVTKDSQATRQAAPEQVTHENAGLNFFRGHVSFEGQTREFATYRVFPSGPRIEVLNAVHIRLLDDQLGIFPDSFEIIAPLDAVEAISGAIPLSHLCALPASAYLELRLRYHGA